MAEVTDATLAAQSGTAGLATQVGGSPTTVGAAAIASDGIDAGNFIEADIDQELFKFNSDDTPLMNLMLSAKKVTVNSPEVDHYMLDEPRSSFTTSDDLAASSSQTAVLPTASEDQQLVQPYTTLLVKGVDGYESDGATTTPGHDLMLICTGTDSSTGSPIIRAVNGPKANTTDENCTIPAIAAGTEIIVLGNALYETQKIVDPDLVIPSPQRIYLQKRGMNQVVSDYFEAQRKRIPFAQAVIAEACISNFKRQGNRTLWAGQQGRIKVKADKGMGLQYIYFTKGIRYQFKKELQVEASDNWTIKKLIALAKMFFTGEDVPQTAICLCGKNFLEKIQCIDYSDHPEIQITTKTNHVGWSVTNIHTVFGDIEMKREPTLDRLGWSNSAALLGENRLVHYVRKTENQFTEDIEGQEAKRNGILVWDALALKGSCHIWIDGDGESDDTSTTDTATIVYWDSDDAPTVTAGTVSNVYYLLSNCSGISDSAQAGEMWYYNGSSWVQYYGVISASSTTDSTEESE